MISDAPASAAERAPQRDLAARFPDPRKSYLDRPAQAGRAGTDTRTGQPASPQGSHFAPTTGRPAEDGERDGQPDAESSASGNGSSGLPLMGISTDELRQELVRRQRRLNGLLAQRDKLTQQLADVNAEIAELGGELAPESSAPRRAASAAAGPRRTRAHNDISLPDAIAMAVEVRATVTPAEAADLVKANGYQTTAQNFGILVAHTLAKDPRFKRVERGRYERVS